MSKEQTDDLLQAVIADEAAFLATLQRHRTKRWVDGKGVLLVHFRIRRCIKRIAKMRQAFWCCW